MTAGYSGSYAVNGIELYLWPTEGRWLERPILGTAGSGHPIYSAVRDFEMTFSLADPSEYYQMLQFFRNLGVTGTAVVDLPKYDGDGYLFYSYSGCIVYEPVPGAYFNEHIQEVRWIISNIRT